MKHAPLLMAIGVGLFALALGPTASLSGVPVAHADYNDSRDYSESKAKSQIRAIRKEFAKLDEAILDPRKLKNVSYFSLRAKSIERHLQRAADKDPGWNLSREKAYYADITRRWQLAQSGNDRRDMEEREPDIGDWDISEFAGAPGIKQGVPGFCEGREIQSSSSWIRSYPSLVTTLSNDNLLHIAEHACRAPKFKKRQQWVRAWRQSFSNMTGASDALNSAYFRLWIRSGGSKGDSTLRDSTCTVYGYSPKNTGPRESPSTRSRSSRGRKASRGGTRRSTRATGSTAGQRAALAADKAFHKALAIGLGCEANPATMYRGNISIENLAWWIDRQVNPPSELVRAVYVLSSVGLLVDEESVAKGDWQAKALKSLGAYALVSADIQRLNKTRFEAELKAMNLNEWGRTMARITFSRAQHMGRIYKEAYSTMDKGIQELAFATPQRAFSDWEKLYKANKVGLDLAFDVETRLLSGVSQGIKDCHRTAHAAFVKYVRNSGVRAKDYKEQVELLDDPIANVLLKTSMICAAYEGKSALASVLYKEGLNGTRSWRGPRFFAYFKMIDRYSELKSKDGSFPLTDSQIGFWIRKPSPTMAYRAYESTFNKTGVVLTKSGQIKSIRKTSKGLRLTFKTVSWKETIWDCKETNKIHRIDSSGKIIYRTKCKSKGKRTVSSTVKPYVVPASLSGGLKRGQFVRARVSFGENGSVGIPLEVYQSSKRKKLLGGLGILY